MNKGKVLGVIRISPCENKWMFFQNGSNAPITASADATKRKMLTRELGFCRKGSKRWRLMVEMKDTPFWRCGPLMSALSALVIVSNGYDVI